MTTTRGKRRRERPSMREHRMPGGERASLPKLGMMVDFEGGSQLTLERESHGKRLCVLALLDAQGARRDRAEGGSTPRLVTLGMAANVVGIGASECGDADSQGISLLRVIGVRHSSASDASAQDSEGNPVWHLGNRFVMRILGLQNRGGSALLVLHLWRVPGRRQAKSASQLPVPAPRFVLSFGGTNLVHCGVELVSGRWGTTPS